MATEDEIVRIYREQFGLGDAERNDAEAVRVSNRLLVMKTDTLVYDTDVPPGMTPRQASRKAAVACVSDFAAKGVRPRWALVSITTPPSYDVRVHRSMAAGLADAAEEFGFSILGGDTNRGSETSITVCMMGLAKNAFPKDGHSGWKEAPRLPGRGGAGPGEMVYASGPFGLAAAGLYALQNGVEGPRGSRKAVLEPRTRLNFGVKLSPHFTSSMDSSDGLSTTLHEIAARSGVAIVVDGEPAADGVAKFAARHKLNPDDLVYNGGEEYEIVFTLERGRANELAVAVRATETPLTYIGYTEEGEGVYLKREDQDRVRLPDGGWKAFEDPAMCTKDPD